MPSGATDIHGCGSALAGWCSTPLSPGRPRGSRSCCCTGSRRPPPAGPGWRRRWPRPVPGAGAQPAGLLAGRSAGGGAGLPDAGACRRRPCPGRGGRGGPVPPGRSRLGRRGRLGPGQPPPGAGGHPDPVSTPHPRAFAAALLTGGQLLRSTYIGFFRIPRLPELALGARGSRGLRFLLARSGLAPAWAERYARALADPGALAAALAWYRAAIPFDMSVPRAPVPTRYVWGLGDPALGRRAATTTGRWVVGPYRLDILEGGRPLAARAPPRGAGRAAPGAPGGCQRPLPHRRLIPAGRPC
jgi:hypothetical protein